MRRNSIIAISVAGIAISGACGPAAAPGEPMVEEATVLVADSVLRAGLIGPDGEPIELHRAADVVLAGDSLIIVDTGNDRLVIADTTFRQLATIGREGAGPGEFQVPLIARVRDDAVVVMELGNGRFSRFGRDGVFRDIVRSHGTPMSIALAEGNTILAPAGSATDFLVRIDGERVEPFAPRPDTLSGEAARSARLGRASLRVAVTAGDTVHVLDDDAGVLHKYAPDGRLVGYRSLPATLLDSMRSRTAEITADFAKQGLRVSSAPLTKSMSVTRDGDLLVLLVQGRTAGLLIDPRTYRARRIIVVDADAHPAALLSASSAALSGSVLYAISGVELLAIRLSAADSR